MALKRKASILDLLSRNSSKVDLPNSDKKVAPPPPQFASRPSKKLRSTISKVFDFPKFGKAHSAHEDNGEPSTTSRAKSSDHEAMASASSAPILDYSDCVFTFNQPWPSAMETLTSKRAPDAASPELAHQHRHQKDSVISAPANPSSTAQPTLKEGEDRPVTDEMEYHFTQSEEERSYILSTLSYAEGDYEDQE